MKKLILSFLLIPVLVFAQTDSGPVNTESVLKELQKIKGSRETNLKSQLNQIFQTVKSAASNGTEAIDLYLQAEFSTQFNGQNQDKVQFLEWKKKQSDKLKSKTFQEALRLYLSYLALTIQSSMGTKNEEMIQPLINYTVMASPEIEFLTDGDEFMKRPLDNSLIVRYLGLTLTPQTSWINTPGNLDEMYSEVIMPDFRLKKSPQAIEYWNRQIEKESNSIENEKRVFQVDQFTRIRKPALLWNKALEFYLIGQKNRGITEMLSVIKAYPTHPDAAGWVTKLEEYIATQTPLPSSAPLPPSTPSITPAS